MCVIGLAEIILAELQYSFFIAAHLRMTASGRITTLCQRSSTGQKRPFGSRQNASDLKYQPSAMADLRGIRSGSYVDAYRQRSYSA